MSRASAAHIRTADPLQSRAGNPNSCTEVDTSDRFKRSQFSRLFGCSYSLNENCVSMIHVDKCVSYAELGGVIVA